MKRIVCLVLVLIFLCACAPAKEEVVPEFWGELENEEQPENDEENMPDDVIGGEPQPATEEDIQRDMELLNIICGETWHSDNYNKTETVIPQVEPEETVEGELWFPPINNTAPIEEIAPTISYDNMLDGLFVNTYYPENPEDYTAQALNENAFPIAFFRKVNDLYYYTVCKVEGGGYMYYFFMANSGVTIEEAKAVYSDMTEIAPNGNEVIEKYYNLFNGDLADISGMDITKEAIWRGSIYSAQAHEDPEKLYKTALQNSTDLGAQLANISDLALEFKAMSAYAPKMFERLGAHSFDRSYDNFFDVQSAIISYNRKNLNLPIFIICDDSVVEFEFTIAHIADQFAAVNAKEATEEDYENALVFGAGSPDYMDSIRIEHSLKGFFRSQLQEDENNTVVLNILPQDYMW